MLAVDRVEAEPNCHEGHQEAEYERRLYEWVPSPEDRAFVKSLMQKVVEPGKMAAWVAPPDRGINNLPVDYEYVHLA